MTGNTTLNPSKLWLKAYFVDRGAILNIKVTENGKQGYYKLASVVCQLNGRFFQLVHTITAMCIVFPTGIISSSGVYKAGQRYSRTARMSYNRFRQ